MGGRVILGSGYATAKAFIPPNQNKMERAQPRMLHPAGVGRLTPCILAACTQYCPRVKAGPGGFGCTGGASKGVGGRVTGGRFGVIEATGCLPGMGRGWGFGPVLGCWQVQRPHVQILFCIRRENCYF